MPTPESSQTGEPADSDLLHDGSVDCAGSSHLCVNVEPQERVVGFYPKAFGT